MRRSVLVAISAFAILSAACNKSVEERAREYAAMILTAEASGDSITMHKLQDEAQQWTDGLSAEEQHRVLKAIVDVYREKDAR